MATVTAKPQVAASTKIPTLDGWRGVAILLVLADHFQHTLWGGWLVCSGQHGVTIFFVLSGFLITTKFLEAPINLKRFYIRRVFRLMPAAWAYLAFVLLCDVAFQTHYVTWSRIVSCVFFFRNYVSFAPQGATNHFWSLCVEEQFYLVWPVTLLLLGVKRSRWIALAGIMGCGFWRYTHWGTYNHGFADFATEVRADALLVGCLMAILMKEDGIRSLIRRSAKYWAVPAILALAYYILFYRWLPPLMEDICIAALIGAGVEHPGHTISRWLNVWPLAPLGVMSYSIYVWQQFFFDIRRGPVSTPLMMALMPVFALVSYHFIETPFRNIGYKITSKFSHRVAALT